MTKVPTILNILDIKDRVPKGALIHFSAAQWKSLIADIPQSRVRPKYGVALEGYPIPGGDVLGQPICIQNPCEICRIRVSGLGPGGEMIFECQCRPDRERCPEDAPPPPPSPLCRLAVQRTSRGIQLVCQSQGCTRTCRLGAVQSQGRWIISCQCR